MNGANGTSGTSGNSGTSGSSGTSGTSGATGGSGTSGSSGTSGTSGATGGSGTSGSSGTSGVNGANGTSGTSGVNGANGTSGTSGVNGANGTSGTSGVDGTSGTSGTSPSGGITGSLTAEYIPYASSSSSLADSFLYNDMGNAKLYSIFSGVALGLEIDRNNSLYSLGDFGSTAGGNFIQIDDSAQSIEFSTDELIFNGGLTNNSTWTATGRFLEVTINGVAYNIELFT